LPGRQTGVQGELSCNMTFRIGQMIENYELLDIIESSKAGVSYKVRNTLAERIEVLKVLPEDFQDDEERVARFMREMKVHARLLHPNIVTFYNASEIEGRLVMTMEFVEGETLADRLQFGNLPWQDAADCICQVLSALDYAHAHGVVHRDISPEKLIITADGTVKLSGFELARAATDPQLTQVGTAVGSIHYISPEQVKGVSAPDGRSDLYSLGIVFYEAITGKPPFESVSEFELMAAHVNTIPRPPSELNPEAPVELDTVILTAMAKEPSQRYQTATEFREAIESAKASVEAIQYTLPAREEEPVTPPADELAALAATSPSVTAKPGLAGLLFGGREPSSSELVMAGALTFVIATLLFFVLLAAIKI
jgi:serine/threonine protein kinase